MADILTKQQRSLAMSAVKSKGSKIEKQIANFLKQKGVHFKIHPSKLPGKPDFIINKTHVVIFVDSCFWHGCKYHGSIPKSNKIFWKKKIERNKTRDKEINLQYKKMGWSVIRIWEHDLKSDSEKISRIFKGLSKK